MLNTRHLIQTLHAAGADGNVIYVSVPITSGRLEIDLMVELGIRSPATLRSSFERLWLDRVVAPNSSRAKELADTVRSADWTDGRIVVDPSRLNIEGWDQDDYNSFWIDLMTSSVDLVVAAPGWEFSRGARGEISLAMKLGIEVVNSSGQQISVEELKNTGDTVRHELLVKGWSASAIDSVAPPLEPTRIQGPPSSAQSQVFNWLGEERRRQVKKFGAQADDRHTVEEGLRPEGWWSTRLASYLEQAREKDLQTEAGRLALAKFTATACALLESTFRSYGPLRSHGKND